MKAAVVSRSLKLRGLEETLIHTGQHFDANMSDVFFSELEIPKPDYNLGIGGGSHGQNTGRMIEAIEAVLQMDRPDWVIVYGDTDSTLAGTLAAVKLHIPVAHVEAGLRSFNRKMPEEINRILSDHAANILFPPTQTAVENLAKEGIRGETVRQVGDVMYDAALVYGEKAERGSTILSRMALTPHHYILATIHRAENTDDESRLRAITQGFSGLEIPVVLPLHPRTRARLARFGLSLPENVIAVEPVGYLDMIMLEKNAALVATDSGGVQKEAFFYEVPCVTLREETEWVELVDAGWNRLAPPSSSASVDRHLAAAMGTRGRTVYPYGKGDASEQICDALTEQYREYIAS